MVKEFDRENIETEGTARQTKERFSPGEIWKAKYCGKEGQHD